MAGTRKVFTNISVSAGKHTQFTLYQGFTCWIRLELATSNTVPMTKSANNFGFSSL